MSILTFLWPENASLAFVLTNHASRARKSIKQSILFPRPLPALQASKYLRMCLLIVVEPKAFQVQSRMTFVHGIVHFNSNCPVSSRGCR